MRFASSTCSTGSSPTDVYRAHSSASRWMRRMARAAGALGAAAVPEHEAVAELVAEVEVEAVAAAAAAAAAATMAGAAAAALQPSAAVVVEEEEEGSTRPLLLAVARARRQAPAAADLCLVLGLQQREGSLGAHEIDADARRAARKPAPAP